MLYYTHSLRAKHQLSVLKDTYGGNTINLRIKQLFLSPCTAYTHKKIQAKLSLSKVCSVTGGDLLHYDLFVQGMLKLEHTFCNFHSKPWCSLVQEGRLICQISSFFKAGFN